MRKEARLYWRRLDTVIVLAVTLLYSVLAFVNLGSTSAPQTYWKSAAMDESVVLDLGERHEDFSMLYYCFVTMEDFAVEVSDDGEHWSDPIDAEMVEGMCYQWKYLGGGTSYDDAEKLSGRYVRITANQIGMRLGEVIFRETVEESFTRTGADGEEITQTRRVAGPRIPAAPAVFGNTAGDGAERIIDEPDSLAGEPGWFNSTYFDEIYHVRTAYEHLHGETPYETSHPPLGKLLMSVSIAVFGMTPFGWRFAGALAGVLMLPVLYLLVKQLTKRTLPAALATGLMALDTMHFTQTRIATIDSFAVLFILLCFFFMLRFMQRDLGEGGWKGLRKFLPDLALSGFFMGCGIATKWIVIYAAAGLALCYFWTCIRYLLREKADDGEGRAKPVPRVILLCLWCLLFFILIPAAIYLLCYIPFFIATIHTGGIRNLGDYLLRWFDIQKYCIFDYHSRPGLGMDHPFYSPWYEWPLSVRPMYYFMEMYLPEGLGQAIFCFGNPAVWYPCAAAILITAGLWVLSHRYLAPGLDGIWHVRAESSGDEGAASFLLIGFLAQFLPWVLVPRGTYIYHYFASVPFLIASLSWLADRVHRKRPAVGLYLTCALLGLALVFFAILFPYASGLPVPTAWLDLGSRILRLYH